MIPITFEIIDRDANVVRIKLLSSPREYGFVFYTGYYPIASYEAPEFTGDCIYIFGKNTDMDSEVIEIPAKDFDKVTCAITEFNVKHTTSGVPAGLIVCCDHLWLQAVDCKCQHLKCHICKETHPKSEMRKVKYGSEVYYICKHHKKTKMCPNCLTKHYFLTTHVNMHFDVCDHCKTKEIPWGEQFNYSHKPEPIFHHFDKGEVVKLTKLGNTIPRFWMGHEVEQQYDPAIIKEIVIGKMQQTLPKGLVYCKSDGSIGTGTEAVTHPFSWEYYKNTDLSGILNPFLKDWRNSGYQVGHHVHISLKSFSTLHLYRFLKFHHTHFAWVEFISQRKLENYCKQTGGAVTKAYNGKNREKYEFINLPGNTVEWRAFASPVTYEEFCKNTEYLYAAYQWTKDLSNKDLDSKLLLTYIKNNTKTYPNLVSWINKQTFSDKVHVKNLEHTYPSMGKINKRTPLDRSRVCHICGERTRGLQIAAADNTRQHFVLICNSCLDDSPHWRCEDCDSLILGIPTNNYLCSSCEDTVVADAECSEFNPCVELPVCNPTSVRLSQSLDMTTGTSTAPSRITSSTTSWVEIFSNPGSIDAF